MPQAPCPSAARPNPTILARDAAAMPCARAIRPGAPWNWKLGLRRGPQPTACHLGTSQVQEHPCNNPKHQPERVAPRNIPSKKNKKNYHNRPNPYPLPMACEAKTADARYISKKRNAPDTLHQGHCGHAAHPGRKHKNKSQHPNTGIQN